jgi:flagellar hook-associated protein 1 FlgK
MPSTFFGIEIGSRALASDQIALDTVSQNISNVSTPGYSRQVVQLQETAPYILPASTANNPGELGTGVTVASINRVVNEFLNQQVWSATGSQSALSSLNTVLQSVQQAYNEPSTSGVGSLMTAFFNSFSNLSTDPSNTALRSTVVESAQSLVTEIQSVNTALSQINPQTQTQISADVQTINRLGSQIAGLSNQIVQAVAEGSQPNDLLDQRDQLLTQLSGLVNIQVTNTTNPQTGALSGAMQVSVGGYTLVQGDTFNALPSTVTTSGNTLGLVTSNNQTIPINSGELYGLIQSTTLVNGYQANLNTLVSNLITAVNTQHEAGYNLNGQTGQPFFTGTNAANIAVSPTIVNDPNAIAAAAASGLSGTYAAGNGDNASAIAALTTTPVINGSSLDDYYNAGISQIGADAQSYSNQSTTQGNILNQLQNQQSSVSGVSLDEELTNMLQYQRSYQAAARVINVMDNVLDTIINGLGGTAAATA